MAEEDIHGAEEKIDPGGAGEVDWFHVTNGRFIGLFGLLTCAGAVFVLVHDGLTGGDLSWVLGLLLVAVLIWAALLRPRVGLTGHEVVLRSMVDDVYVPLAAVDRLAIRAVTAVRAGDKRYLSAGVGRQSKALRPQGFTSDLMGRQWRGLRDLGDKYAGPDPQEAYPDFVEDRIRSRMDRARQVAGVRHFSPEQAALAAGVRRVRAWPEIVALTGLALALVVSLLV